MRYNYNSSKARKVRAFKLRLRLRELADKSYKKSPFNSESFMIIRQWKEFYSIQDIKPPSVAYMARRSNGKVLDKQACDYVSELDEYVTILERFNDLKENKWQGSMLASV